MDAAGFDRVLKDSGLSRTELAKLYGVSRQSFHYWINESLPRENSLLARMATVITTALLNSIDRRILPLPASGKEVRAARIARMAKTLQALKPAPAKG